MWTVFFTRQYTRSQSICINSIQKKFFSKLLRWWKSQWVHYSAKVVFFQANFHDTIWYCSQWTKRGKKLQISVCSVCSWFSVSLSHSHMMISHAELITAAVWFLAIHLLQPPNCNLSKKMVSGYSHILFSPSVPLPSTALLFFPEAHQININHFHRLWRFKILVEIHIYSRKIQT